MGVDALGASLTASMESSLRPTLNVLSLPQTITCHLSRPILGDWNANVHAQYGLQANEDRVSTTLSNDALDVSISYDENTVRLKKGFQRGSTSNNQCKFTVCPTYNLHTSTPDLTLAYEDTNKDQSIQLHATPNEQKLTLSSRIAGSSHKISPSITSRGKFAIGWRKDTERGAITTTLKLKESLECKWEDGDWICAMNTPLVGWMKSDGVNIKVKRRVQLV